MFWYLNLKRKKAGESGDYSRPVMSSVVVLRHHFLMEAAGADVSVRIFGGVDLEGHSVPINVERRTISVHDLGRAEIAISGEEDDLLLYPKYTSTY